MQQSVVAVGIILLFMGIIFIILGSLSGKGDTKMAVGGFIGPIPFGWANDPQMFKYIIILIITIAVLFFVLRGYA